jgi:light-regulated signal transduction histidine kinase (bacteriophytochrome)
MTLSPGWYVTSASANLADFAGMATHDALGRPLADLLGGDTVHALRNRLALLRDPADDARLLRHPLGAEAQLFDFAMRLAGTAVILEMQPNPEREAPDIAGAVRASAARLEPHRDVSDLLGEAARQCRAMTGFDAVTVYRAGSAEIVAESTRGAVAASPCPDTARRLVADREADSVPMLPATATLPATPLRAPSNAERQQMMESGALALVTVPIIVDGDPWGLILCRHERPKMVSLERFGALELFADIVAMRLGVLG